jgi:hypothetical protein
MGRHITAESAMHQGRFLAQYFQKVRVWDTQEQETIAHYLQYHLLPLDPLEPRHDVYRKVTIVRPEGKVEKIVKEYISAFTSVDRGKGRESPLSAEVESEDTESAGV